MSGQVYGPKMVTPKLNFQSNDRFKGSLDQKHFNFEINVGKSRIQHSTTLNLNLQSILSRFQK